MAVPVPKQGEYRTTSRTLSEAQDPLQLYRQLTCDASVRNTLLLESADTTNKTPVHSRLMISAALRVTARGRNVTLAALSANGERALTSLTSAFESRGVLKTASATEAELVFGPVPEDEDEQTRLMAPSPLDVIRAMCHELAPVAGAESEELISTGTFSYDLLGSFERLPEPKCDRLEFPDICFWLADEMVDIDHLDNVTRITATTFGSDVLSDVTSAIVEHGKRCESLRAECERTRSKGVKIPPPRLTPSSAFTSDQIEVDISDDDFAKTVEVLKERIVIGDVFQIVPSRTFSAPCADPLATYSHLKSINPSPYMFYVAAEDFTLFGASPETAVKVSAYVEATSGESHRQVKIRPIAGTRSRGRRADGSLDRDLDNRLEVELRLHEKEVAEHMMLIDLARNDVARVCIPGSRCVDEILTTERYSHVMHLVSNVVGNLRPELDALHAYQASMNMGTLVGAPKVRAAQILRETEPSKRGPYGGAVGYYTSSGNLDTAIVIRSGLVRNGTAYVRAGAGVVYDSDPAAEVEETRRKAAAVLSALRSVNSMTKDGEA